MRNEVKNSDLSERVRGLEIRMRLLGSQYKSFLRFTEGVADFVDEVVIFANEVEKRVGISADAVRDSAQITKYFGEKTAEGESNEN